MGYLKKFVLSFLLVFPAIYNLLFWVKNRFFVSYYLGKLHEPDFRAFGLISEDRPQLFLDIGANVGMSALSFFTLKSNAKVVSFEPNPVNYSYLKRLAAKFSNFRYEKVGLGAEAGSLDFFYPIYNGKKMTALGSCDRDKAGSWLGRDTVFFYDREKLKIEQITVEIKTLDSFELEPEFIKIDMGQALILIVKI